MAWRRLRQGLLPVVALLVAGLLAACTGARATPLYAIKIDPTPTPTLSPGNAARVAFTKAVLSGKLNYHIDFQGSVNGAGNIIEMRGALDVAGKDYQIAASYVFPGEGTFKYANKLVKGVPWVRPPDEAWQKDGLFDPAKPNSPFVFINDDDDVTFLKSETVGGETFHRVRFENSLIITPNQFPAGNVTQEKVRRSWVELSLNAKGVPLTGHWRLEGKVRVDGQLQEIILQADLAFTKYGAAMTIQTP